MTERMKRHYRKEEEFLDEFPGVGPAVSEAVAGEYEPDYGADDDARSNVEYLLKSGELSVLAFDSASVFHENDRFSSVQVSLRSSKRIITVRVVPIEKSYKTEIIVDKEP